MDKNHFGALLIKNELKARDLENTPDNIASIAKEFGMGYTPRKGEASGSISSEPAKYPPLPPLGEDERTVPVNYGKPVIGKRYGVLPSLDSPKEKEPLIDLTGNPPLPYLDRKNLYRLYMDQQGYRNPYMSVEEEEKMNMQNEQRQEQEAIALADKNTMGAFDQLTENDNKAQSLFGNINAAARELSDYKAQNAANLLDPMVQATIKATEGRISEMKQEYQNRKALGDQMAQTLLNSNQGRYGYVNDYVNARNVNREQQPENNHNQAELQPVSDIIEYTPEQASINKFIKNYKSINSITSNTDLEDILASNEIPLTQANREYLKQRIASKASDNLKNEQSRLGIKGTGLDVAEKEKSSKDKDIERLAITAKDAEKLNQGEMLLKNGTVSDKRAWLKGIKESGTASGTMLEELGDLLNWKDDKVNREMRVELEALRAKSAKKAAKTIEELQAEGWQ
jgi:hypothetical protein